MPREIRTMGRQIVYQLWGCKKSKCLPHLRRNALYSAREEGGGIPRGMIAEDWRGI